MNQALIYLLKCIISSGLLFGYYCLSLRNKKFHEYNRAYLLCSLSISAIVPFFNFTFYSFQQKLFTDPASFSYQPISINRHQLYTSFDWLDLLLIVFISISGFMFIMLLKKIIWIYKLKHQYPVTKMEGFDLIETDIRQAPFSFLDNLFWRTNISVDEENGRKIFAHELAHIKGKHSYDKLFSQVVLCFLWVNPFYWLIQKELNLLHEFIADSKSIGQGDTRSFAEILLQSHNDGRYLNPSHAFFNSPIERRIHMILISKNKYNSLVTRVCALPVILFAIVLFSFKMVNAQTSPKLNSNSPATVNKVSVLQNNEKELSVKQQSPPDTGRRPASPQQRAIYKQLLTKNKKAQSDDQKLQQEYKEQLIKYKELQTRYKELQSKSKQPQITETKRASS